MARSGGIKASGSVELPIDPRRATRVFEGFGAVSAGASSRLLIDYDEPARTEILDFLFSPGVGAALQHLTVEVGSDTNTTDGAEPSHQRSRDDLDFTRGYEWWLMSEARARNPEIQLEALTWGAPGWLGDGNYASPDTVAYLVRYLEGARDQHGLTLDYVGVWNEMHYDVDWIKRLKRGLQEASLDVEVVAADGTWQIADDMRDDPVLREAVDVIGVHYPELYGGYRPHAHEFGVRLWASEDGAWKRLSTPASGEWAGARELAKFVNRNYLEWGLTKTLVWSPVTSYYDALMFPGSGLMYANEPWSGHYRVQPAVWVAAHVTHFVRPGWRYVRDACVDLPQGGSVVSLVSPDRLAWSLVAETGDAVEPQRVVVRLAEQSRGPVQVWRTREDRCFEHIETLDATDEIVLELEPESVVTATSTGGHSRRNASPPGSRPFPFPWRETFEGYRDGRMPRYFADQEGAFEVRAGVLEQVVTEPPIPWTSNFRDPDVPSPTPADNLSRPFTIVGDRSWRNYEVAVEVSTAGPGEAALLGRVTGPPTESRTLTLPGGYWLAIDAAGRWELRIAPLRDVRKAPLGIEHLILERGQSPDGGSWRSLALRFAGSRIVASVDGTEVCSVDDETYGAGLAGLGTGWNVARFRRFEVSQVDTHRAQ